MKRTACFVMVGEIIESSTIPYTTNGRQDVVVLTGDGASGTGGPLTVVQTLTPPRGHKAIDVFALPEGH